VSGCLLHPSLANARWRGLIRRDEDGRPSPSCLLDFFNATRRGDPPHHVCWTFSMRRGGETLPVVSVGLFRCDEEGRPSLSCLLDLFDATRRGDPPRRMCLTYSMRRGGKPSPSRLFDLIRCDEEDLPSPSHLFDIIQCGKGGKPSCYVFHLIRLITYIVNSKYIDITPKRPVLTG